MGFILYIKCNVYLAMTWIFAPVVLVAEARGLYSAFIKIWQDKDGFHINGYHHDGTNSADIRIINKRGKAWLEKNEDEVSRSVLCETLAKPCFSRSFPMGNKNYLF